MNILPIYDWKTPVSVIPGQSIGNFHIKKKPIKAGTHLSMDVAGYDFCLFTKDTIMTILREGILENNDTESVWMSDSPMEYYMAWELVARASGPRVLIGGLGLGLLAHLLLLRKDITNITIIEKQVEVIQMVKPYLPLKVEVIGGDFLYAIQTLSDSNKEFETVIADIWKSDSDGDKEVAGDCICMMDDYYPDATKLFWVFQQEFDSDRAEYARMFLEANREIKERQ